MTIPELKHAFDALDHGTRQILKTGSKETQIKEFQRLWRSLFGRPVRPAAAEAYLAMKRSGPVAGPRGKTRKMKGGAALAGAPLDYTLRPGIDGAHGSFPTYQAQGLSFYNTVNQEGMFQDCGVKDITPKIPADLGSNTVQFPHHTYAVTRGGGPLADLAHVVSNRPFSASVPQTPQQDMADYWSGRPLGASPDPAQTRLRYV
jgi:hypothetical protein